MSILGEFIRSLFWIHPESPVLKTDCSKENPLRVPFFSCRPDGKPWTSSEPMSGVGPQGPQSVVHQPLDGPPVPLDPSVHNWGFDEYQAEALKTANCPSLGHPIIYPLLGMFGEMGEVVEKLHNCMHHNMAGIWTYPERGEVIKEFGDVLWYVAVLSHYLGYRFSEVIGLEEGDDIMDVFSAMMRDSPILGIGGPVMAASYEMSLKLRTLLIHQGRLAERVKKIFRDADGQFDEKRKLRVMYEIGQVIEWLTRLANTMNIPLSVIAQANVDKLRSRRERNQIHGEGDNR